MMTERSKIAVRHLLGWLFIGSLITAIVAMSCKVTYETSLTVAPIADTAEVDTIK